MPFRSSLARSAGKLLGVFKERDLSLRGATQSSRFTDTSASFIIYMMGGGATTRNSVIRAGYSQATIQIPSSVLGSYNRLEVIVGEGGPNSSAPPTGQKAFGGGGSGNNTPISNGSPGGGGSFVFLSSPGSTDVFAASGHSLNVPVSDADDRCLIVAGGSGGNDKHDGAGGAGGGGLSAQYIPAVPGTDPSVDRGGGGDAYIGKEGVPGTWSAGGGGGGYEGGYGNNDFDAWGGCGYVGHTNPSESQPFTGPSSVNPGFVYTDGYTIANGPAAGSPWNPYTVPASGSPYIPGPSGGQNNPGTVTVIGPSGTTTFSYTGSIQYYPFSAS